MSSRPEARRWLIGAAIVVGVLAQVAALLVLFVAVRVLHPSCPRAAVPVTSLSTTTSRVASDYLVFDSNRSGNYEIYSMTTGGREVNRLTNNSRWDSWWPQLSPDRGHILFYRTPAGVYDKDYHRTSLWMMNADGSHVEELLPVGAYGWNLQGHAEWSPDGTELVMFGGCGSSPQIYTTDALGHHPRQVTDRGGSNLDPSWSPDGRRIAFVGCPSSLCFPSRLEVYEVPASGGTPVRITYDGIRDNDPAYSPNGRWIAWLSETSDIGLSGSWNIRIAHPDGTGLHLVTDDHNINSRPAWSPNGQLIYFHRLVYDARDPHFGIWAIHPDGAGLRDLTIGQPGASTYPST